MSLSQAEFARQVGHTRQYINKLIKQGKLSKSQDGGLDEERAFAEFQALGDVAHSATRAWNRQQKSGAKSKRESATNGNGEGVNTAPGVDTENGEDFNDPAVAEAHRVFNKSKAKEKAYSSLIREIEYYIRKGDYVPISEVRREAEEVVGSLIATLDSMPSRLAPRLLQRESLPEIQEILEAGINEVKEAIQAEMRRIEAEKEKRG